VPESGRAQESLRAQDSSPAQDALPAQNSLPARGSVFITGASAGIGAATARLLASEGYTVYAGVHSGAGALDGLPGVRQVPLDVTDPGSVAAAARRVTELQLTARAADQGLHAVINNAGIIVQGPLELVPPADLLRQFRVNTLGPAYVVQAFLPLLRAGHGRVINISAPTARLPVPFMAPISASKAALASLSDALRLELAAWGIPVCVVVPGGTDTQIFAKAQTAAEAGLAAADPGRVALYSDQLAAVGRAAARQRLGPVEPVARAVLTAVQAGRPRRQYTAGSGARVFGILAHLPASQRDRLVSAVFGLGKIKAPAGAG
jgi:NAD(P)-dependent dehydrogenase (short-subunit alcohol dehydrogenase family)